MANGVKFGRKPKPVMQSNLPAGDSRAVVFATNADGL
jgi:hypothetical protein